jgi:ABC-type Fe3+ transport system substrate-binding protein
MALIIMAALLASKPKAAKEFTDAYLNQKGQHISVLP